MKKKNKNQLSIDQYADIISEDRVLNLSIKDEIKLTKRQEEYAKTIKNNTITICTGPAGTAKTFVGCKVGLELLQKNSISKIVAVKPIKESGEELGFLPGDIEKKTDPYFESFISNFAKLLGQGMDAPTLIRKKLIDMRPVSYMRGITLDNCLIFLDEAQNLEIKSLMLLVTRLGNNSKMIISGDVTQYDIRKNDVVLHTFIDMVNGINNVAHFQFERSDIVRNPLLVEITDRYDTWKEDGRIKLK